MYIVQPLLLIILILCSMEICEEKSWTIWMSPISVFVVLNSCEILFCCESVNVQILCKNNGEEIEHPRQNLTKTSKTINFSQVSLSERGKEKWKAN